MPTMIGPTPQELGVFSGIVAAMPSPTLASDGVAVNGARFVNVWVGMTSARASTVVFQCWLYRTGQGWTFYSDVPATTLQSTNGGGLFQLELRGAERAYAQLTTFTGAPTCTILYEGVTY